MGRILTMDERKQRAMLEALDAADGNMSEAAELLGVSRTTLYNWADRYGRPNLGIGTYDPDSDVTPLGERLGLGQGGNADDGGRG